MRGTLLLLILLTAPGGCQTHRSLRDNTLHANGTLTDLTYRQILTNVALFEANPSALPAISVVNAGTVTVADQQSLTGNATYAPTLTFSQQGGGALPILSLLANPGGSRTVTENWSLTPVTDADNLRRIRCAFQLLVLGQPTAGRCDDCRTMLAEFFLDEDNLWECRFPRGWYGSGCRKDVPRDACYVGSHGNQYVWVLPEEVEGLTRFSLTVLDLATGKPHAPTKTVVKTLNPDGSVAQTQVTTTEIDETALEKLKQGSGRWARPRETDADGPLNPGLFFIPHN